VSALDGLRGCAVLMVMLYHFTAALEHPVSLGGALVRKAFSGGWIGVDLFFVLSGYLITGILFDAKGANEEGEGRRTPARRYFGAFYGRRALRIFPLYYGVLVLLFVSIMGPKLWLIVLLVGISHAPRIARVTRAATLEVAQRLHQGGPGTGGVAAAHPRLRYPAQHHQPAAGRVRFAPDLLDRDNRRPLLSGLRPAAAGCRLGPDDQ
jgi:hypothetical protein